jgi:hypothetical protein
MTQVKKFKLTRNYKFTKTVTSKRKQRQAKKGFKKEKQVPTGWLLLYRMPSSTSDNLVSSNVRNFQEKINTHAMKMFKKPYYSLTSQQQTKLFEDLNTGDKSSKETIH